MRAELCSPGAHLHRAQAAVTDRSRQDLSSGHSEGGMDGMNGIGVGCFENDGVVK